MPTRRQLLTGMSALAIAQLAGCGWRGADLRVRLLQGSLPPQLVGAFRREFGDRLDAKIRPVRQLKEIADRLELLHDPSKRSLLQGLLAFGQSPVPADLATLGDFWLTEAIADGLLQPLEVESIPGWERVPEPWQAAVRRDKIGRFAADGNFWGAPYRWGCTAIAYRSDLFADNDLEPPQDWSDLWRPELRDRFSLLNHPREVIGLTLKKLGRSYNTPDLASVPELQTELDALQEQVKFYSSDNYLQPLMLGHTWLAVGWSADFLALRSRYPALKTIMPRSGTALWTETWVQPRSARTEPTKLREEWLGFWWRPDIAARLTELSDAASPVLLALDPEVIPPTVRGESVLYPNTGVLDACEFLSPLTLSARQQYLSQWRQLRERRRA
ncbi:spermidine/putrescine-binding periplasmic protein [Rubidibacter lacunae KORDI 51-2]|uniref:Spermidine/putrescine-binding periplasmic protein n=1 Tax=Rubidibacter lacunae KORDI 51-2 TaxID=582515 RepID=U5DPM7_9CHRO|nr:extracellular solute-binding protein [Rubidibacter lacunae]ERN42554.1 spermidine/putrescine-binding periplasmic protein [Rubidibacter lacunae KORDI 51-2]